MSVNLNEYDVREGSLMILTDQDIVKVEKGSDDEIKNLHWVMIVMSPDSQLPMYRDAVRSLISSMVSIAAGQWIADVNRMRDRKVIMVDSRSEHKILVFR